VVGASIRLALVSDTHIPEAGPELFPQVYEAFAGVDAILHAGDIYELAVIERMGEIAPVYAARGNGDDGSGGRVRQPEHEWLREGWVLEFGGVKIGLTHALPVPAYGDYTLERATARYFGDVALDVAVHGDTHVEDIRHVDGVLCVNPGSPTFPHNLTLQYGTVGFLDIADGRAEASIWRLTDDGIAPFEWDTCGRPW
jgi:putative phosphoesterase